MIRGFKKVIENKTEYSVSGKLPTRADSRSAGYDFYSPISFIIPPMTKFMLFTNIKAYMQEDEVLMLYVRSSIGVKKGLTLANGTGVIDSSYYSNQDNDGNIGVPLFNGTSNAVSIKAGERIAQGVFIKYLVADEDECLSDERVGGFGSSGK